MLSKSGCQSGCQSPLTKVEKELLSLITDKRYNLKQILLIKKCSRQNVYKLLKNIKNKGYVNISLNQVVKSQGSNIQPNQVRLHSQEFNIKLIWQDNKYQNLLKESNVMFLDGHTIKLYKNSIEIYSGEGTSFYGENEQRADKKACEYWTRFFVKLENNIKAIIIKDGVRNIKEVNHHYERGDSEVCGNADEHKEIIRVYCPIDGKLAYWTDHSIGENDETGHPISAKHDRKAIDKQINDWRINNPPTNSEIAENLNKASQIILSNQSLIVNLPNILVGLEKQIKSHLKLIKEYRKENKIYRKALERKYKDDSKEQRTLGSWI